MGARYDAAIIGTGPAGLSAAVTLKIRNKSFILFGSSSLSEKVEKAHEINNYLGLPAVTGAELAKRFDEHLKQMQIEINEDRITGVYAMGDYYSIQSKSNQSYEADTVILATGVNFGRPYEGEEKFLGRGVSYCATCDAPLYKNKKVAIIGFSPKEEAEAEFMSEVASEVYYIPAYKEQVSLNDKIKVVNDTPRRRVRHNKYPRDYGHERRRGNGHAGRLSAKGKCMQLYRAIFIGQLFNQRLSGGKGK